MTRFSLAHVSTLGFLALLTAHGAGCSSAHVAGSQDEADRIMPTGTEFLADLTVQLPATACMAGGSCSFPLSTFPAPTLDGAPMTLGTASRVAPGNHTLALGSFQKTITLAASEQRKITLAVVHQDCQNAPLPAVDPTDFGRIPTFTNAACPAVSSIDGAAVTAPSVGTVNVYYYQQGCTYLYGSVAPGASCGWPTDLTYPAYAVQVNGTCYPLSGATPLQTVCSDISSNNLAALGLPQLAQPALANGYNAVFPGDYGFGSDVRTIADGQTGNLSFTLPVQGLEPSQFHVNVTFANSRDLPDAQATTITSNCERNFTFPSGNITSPKSLSAFQFPACSYTLNVPGRTQALSQTADNAITLHRIDVDDVAVTREDGSTFTTKGTFEVYTGGSLIFGPSPTGAGIDALPGDYEVVVKYNSALGAQTNHYQLHF
jgi:hypothetical protein